MATSASSAADPALAWQSTEPIVAPDFNSYFPDNAEAAARLAAPPNRTQEHAANTNLVAMIREGLRRAEPQAGKQWITWLGQQLAANRIDKDQHAQAVELIYHASARPEYQYDALYYGLSRVEKTPAIIKRMIEIAMASEDWKNVIGHVAWALPEEPEKWLPFLEPHLASNDSKIQNHAAVLKQIFSGEITAHDYWTKINTERAKENFGGQMDRLRQQMAEGDSAARAEVVRKIHENYLWLIMDDSWIDAIQAGSSDSDVRLRQSIAALAGQRWAWELKPDEQISPRALELLVEISRDEDREVRKNIRYHGLSRLRNNEVAQRRLREMDFEDAHRELAKLKEYARAAIEQGRFGEVESLLHEIRPGMKEPEPVGGKIAQFVKETEAQLAAARRPNGDLQRQIDAASEGAVIELGAGSFDGPILIEKPVTLRGAGLDRTTLNYQGDGPAVMIRGTKDVRLENLAVHWVPASTGAKIEHPAAVAVRDADVVLHSVSLEPIDRPEQTPYGLMAAGRSEVNFVNGRSRGFAYALIWQDGAGGQVTDSDLRGAGHSVVSIHPYSQVEVARNILADCGYHAVRVTGGTVDMHDNIVMDCKRAGAYLGNKDAHGRIFNNLFTGNLGEIWGYYGSDVVIEHNLFFASKDPAIIFWNTCALVARANSFIQNPAALRQYIREDDPAKNGIRLEGNHYWENKEDIQPRHQIGAGPAADEGFEIAKSASALNGDPEFRDAAAGNFMPEEGSILRRGNKIVAGLSNPKAIHELAQRHRLRFPARQPSDPE